MILMPLIFFSNSYWRIIRGCLNRGSDSEAEESFGVSKLVKGARCIIRVGMNL